MDKKYYEIVKAAEKRNEDAYSHPTVGEAANMIAGMWMSKFDTLAFMAQVLDADDGEERKTIVLEAARLRDISASNANAVANIK